MNEDILGGALFKNAQRKTIVSGSNPSRKTSALRSQDKPSTPLETTKNKQETKKGKAKRKKGVKNTSNKKKTTKNKEIVKISNEPFNIVDITDGNLVDEIQWRIKKNIIEAIGSPKTLQKSNNKAKTAKDKKIKKAEAIQLPRSKSEGGSKHKTLAKIQPKMTSDKQNSKKASATSRPQEASRMSASTNKSNSPLQSVRRSPRVKPRSPPNFLPPELIGMKNTTMPLFFTPTGKRERFSPHLRSTRAPVNTSDNIFRPRISPFPSRNRNVLDVVYTREIPKNNPEMQKYHMDRDKRKAKPFIFKGTSNTNKSEHVDVNHTKSDVLHVMKRMNNLKAKINGVKITSADTASTRKPAPPISGRKYTTQRLMYTPI